MKITITSMGEEIISRNLMAVVDRAADLRPAFELIIEELEEAESEQFWTEGRHGSGGWAPLKPNTVEMKLRKGLDPRILRATGTMETSLTSRSGEAAIREVGSEWMLFGTAVPYAAYHQRGHLDPTPLPQRRVIQLTEVERVGIVKTIQRYVMANRVAKR